MATVLAGAPMGNVEPAPVIADPTDMSKTCVQDLEARADGRTACFVGKDWVGDQLDSTTNKLAVPFALIVLGGLLIALAVVWRVRESLVDRRAADPTAEIEPRALDALVPDVAPAYR